MATADEHRTIAPIVGPDDPRRFTDSGIEIKQLYADAFARRDGPHRLIPTRANSQPAFGQYAKDPHTDVGRALALLVLTLDGDHISHITRFAAISALPHFGLPRTIRW